MNGVPNTAHFAGNTFVCNLFEEMAVTCAINKVPAGDALAVGYHIDLGYI